MLVFSIPSTLIMNASLFVSMIIPSPKNNADANSFGLLLVSFL